jgi:hypothetical protein
LRALLCQKLRRTFPVGAEVEVEPNHRPRNAEAVDENVLHKSVGRQAREGGVEPHHECAGEPGRGQEPQLGGLVRQAEERMAGPQHRARMRLEGQRHRGPAKLAGARLRRLDDRAVAAVHPVEIADRRDRAA